MAKSKFEDDDAMLLAASLRPPMNRWERRAQAISFAAYNVLLDKPAGTDPWPYVIAAAKAHDEGAGAWREGARSKRLLAPPPVGSFEHHLQLARYALAKAGTGAFAKDRITKDRHAKSKK